MYAQKLEGDEWLGDRMDLEKIEKMSGMFPTTIALSEPLKLIRRYRSAIRTAV